MVRHCNGIADEAISYIIHTSARITSIFLLLSSYRWLHEVIDWCHQPWRHNYMRWLTDATNHGDTICSLHIRCKIARSVAERGTWFYFLQRFLRLVSQWFWPLWGVYIADNFPACTFSLFIGLGDRLREKYYIVTAPLVLFFYLVRCWIKLNAIFFYFCNNYPVAFYWLQYIIFVSF